RAYRDFVSAADDWGRGFALVVRGVIARGLGESEHALDLLSDALGYADRTQHPLLIGMSRTIRGFVSIDRGDAEAAEADARAVLAVVAPHGVLDGAQVAPRVLLALARQAAGDPASAVRLLEPTAAAADQPSLLFSRRAAIAHYARALLATGRVPDAVTAARQAMQTPAEDVRSRVTAAQALAEALSAAGETEEARAAATMAVEQAYATEQASERTAADAVLARLSAIATNA
ncbi:MAG TPA: adenylate/guanylate cyclase domain-containing protein, partial [Micromonosporaceae bacterium]|nr:adenylate/guanylate cyclase domain-containing protein [Micromonosporaceae bacterium]